MSLRRGLAVASIALVPSCGTPPRGNDHAAIDARLDALHAAASRADFDAYFACYAPDAVFLGTDATERWTLDAFKAYARPHFAAGRGWTYTPRERHVVLHGPGVAWFDELLGSEKYGTCRGTGVLVRDGEGRWLVREYSLTFLIPNEVAAEATALGRSRTPAGR